MNERIRELAKQATTIEVIRGRGFDETQYIKRFDKEKFAELIVKECAELMYGRDENGNCKDGDTILEHFGVEE